MSVSDRVRKGQCCWFVTVVPVPPFVLIILPLFLSRATGSGVTVAVLLSWEPPEEGDLPVHNYRLTWVPRLAHAANKHALATRPMHSRVPEQGKKSSTRVTQGVRKQFYHFKLHPAKQRVQLAACLEQTPATGPVTAGTELKLLSSSCTPKRWIHTGSEIG